MTERDRWDDGDIDALLVSAGNDGATGRKDAAFLARLKTIPHQYKQQSAETVSPFENIRAVVAQLVGLAGALAAGMAFGIASATADDDEIDLSDVLFSDEPFVDFGIDAGGEQ